MRKLALILIICPLLFGFMDAPRTRLKPYVRGHRQVWVAAKPAVKKLTNQQRVEAELKRWCKAYHVKNSAWLVSKGMHIAHGESHYNPKARNGQYRGVWQMGNSWGTVAQRESIEWSTRRFVKCYAQGGKKALLRHWKATY